MKKLCFLRYSVVVVISCFSAMVFSQEPSISSIEGKFEEGQILTIRGVSFTEKANPKPLLYWTADTGIVPSSQGRKTAWDSKFNGEIIDSNVVGGIIAPGSKSAARIDYSVNSGALLGKVSFETERFYLWRKRYDDFDMLEDQAIRTRYKDLTSINPAYKFPSVGMIVSSTDKSVYGKVSQVDEIVGTSGTVFYTNNYGNFDNKQLVQATIKTGDTLVFYAETDVNMNNPIMKAVSDEGLGVYLTLNHKIIRIWADYGVYPESIHVSLDKNGAFHGYAFPTFWRSSWLNRIEPATKKWVIEEFQYKESSVGKEDGEMMFWQNGIPAWESSKRFMFKTADKPYRLKDIFQTQVSNGAQLGSYEYFDSLYIDDSWHRVVLCDQVTWLACTNPEVLIPVSWNDQEIKAKVRMGALSGADRLYLYVVNENGMANAVGYSSCPKCPEPPVPD